MRRLLAIFVVAVVAAVGCTSSDEPDVQAASPTAAPTIAAPTTAAGGTAAAAEPTPTPHNDCAVGPPALRTDVTSSGNRWLMGSADLSGDPIEIDVDGEPAWVLPWSSDGDWYVALADGTAVVATSDGSTTPAPAVDPDAVPLLITGMTDAPTPATADSNAASFVDPLPDRRTTSNQHLVVSLVEPTDRYAHGVLGDRIEAGAVEVWDPCNGRRTRITIDPPSVIEGTTAMLADVDGDTAPEIIITTSNSNDGARLEVWRTDGTFVAASAPIGRGNRWRNQLGVAPLGPNGELEIVDVRTPHIGGTVQFFQLVDDRLERVANSSPNYTSHVNGSVNLDMGVLVDANDDARPEVLVLNSQRTRLVALERTADGVSPLREVELGSVATTNIALTSRSDDQVAVAIGTRDGRVLIWEPAQSES